MLREVEQPAQGHTAQHWPPKRKSPRESGLWHVRDGGGQKTAKLLQTDPQPQGQPSWGLGWSGKERGQELTITKHLVRANLHAGPLLIDGVLSFNYSWSTNSGNFLLFFIKQLAFGLQRTAGKAKLSPSWCTHPSPVQISCGLG